MPARQKKTFAKVPGKGIGGRAKNPTGSDVGRLLTEGPKDFFKAFKAALARPGMEKRIQQAASNAAFQRSSTGRGSAFNPNRPASISTSETSLITGGAKKKTTTLKAGGAIQKKRKP